MKRYRCPQCGTTAPARFYAFEALRGKLRCYECSTPGHPVYVVVEEATKQKEVVRK